jgi:hypothetical protein
MRLEFSPVVPLWEEAGDSYGQDDVMDVLRPAMTKSGGAGKARGSILRLGDIREEDLGCKGERFRGPEAEEACTGEARLGVEYDSFEARELLLCLRLMTASDSSLLLLLMESLSVSLAGECTRERRTFGDGTADLGGELVAAACLSGILPRGSCHLVAPKASEGAGGRLKPEGKLRPATAGLARG